MFDNVHKPDGRQSGYGAFLPPVHSELTLSQNAGCTTSTIAVLDGCKHSAFHCHEDRTSSTISAHSASSIVTRTNQTTYQK